MTAVPMSFPDFVTLVLVFQLLMISPCVIPATEFMGLVFVCKLAFIIDQLKHKLPVCRPYKISMCYCTYSNGFTVIWRHTI